MDSVQKSASGLDLNFHERRKEERGMAEGNPTFCRFALLRPSVVFLERAGTNIEQNRADCQMVKGLICKRGLEINGVRIRFPKNLMTNNECRTTYLVLRLLFDIWGMLFSTQLQCCFDICCSTFDIFFHTLKQGRPGGILTLLTATAQ